MCYILIGLLGFTREIGYKDMDANEIELVKI
jgi:hypothetical protein